MPRVEATGRKMTASPSAIAEGKRQKHDRKLPDGIHEPKTAKMLCHQSVRTLQDAHAIGEQEALRTDTDAKSAPRFHTMR
jgi:hypothetical protein